VAEGRDIGVIGENRCGLHVKGCYFSDAAITVPRRSFMVTVDDEEFSEGTDNLFTLYYVMKRDAAFTTLGGWLLIPYGPPRCDGFNAPPKFADLISPWSFLTSW
jgi:hypothetical protein